MKTKIILCVLVAFIIAFSALYIFQVWSRTYVDIFKVEDMFFVQHFDPNEKKIFILGSSEIGVLNATYINESLKKYDTNYTVYNLAIASDTPTQRLQSIEKIILLKPKIVIYGIGYRDFADKSTLINSETEKPNNLLPTLSQISDLLMLENSTNNFLNLQSPKYVTVQILNTLLKSSDPKSQYDKTQLISTTKTPFITFAETESTKNSTELQLKYEKYPPNLGYLNFPDKNKEVIALEKIIEKLKQHNIQVIILTTPHANIFFENLNEHNKNVFNLTLQKLRSYDVKIYSLDNKYKNLNIWYDYHHVSIDKNGLVFTNDVLDIIKSETNP